MKGMNAKSASIAQRVIVWLIVLGVLAVVGYCVFSIVASMKQQRVSISVGKANFRAEVADTDELRKKGLSGRQELEENQAMLFVFDSNSQHSIWMKDMRIPIDVIWLDEKKKVVHVEHDIWPDSEPHETYVPPKPARYIIEITAGEAKKAGIKVGTLAQFELGQKR